MFLKSKMLFIYVETGLHVGAGAGLGAIDLPIQRERITGYPIVQSSGLKGALRSVVPDGTPEKEPIFGHQGADYAGSLSVGDARLLLFPVRSLKGVFAWTTSRDCLERFRRDAVQIGLAGLPTDLPAAPPADNAHASGTEVIVDNQTAVLEEFAFKTQTEAKTAAWAKWLAENAMPKFMSGTTNIYQYWQDKLLTSLLVLPNDAFRDFVQHATEVVTRVKLDADTKTVAQGQLWTEERLPADSLLYSPVHATRLRSNGATPVSLQDPIDINQAGKVLNWVATSPNVPHWIQIGGDETVGRGLVRLRWS